MKLAKMKKEDLELLSHKDITYYILEEEGKMNTADLFKKVVTLLELPNKTFDDKIVKVTDDEDEEEEDEEIKEDTILPDESEEDNYDSGDTDDDDDYDDANEDLKDLVVVDEDELEES